jgi:hypothetical protein
MNSIQRPGGAPPPSAIVPQEKMMYLLGGFYHGPQSLNNKLPAQRFV